MKKNLVIIPAGPSALFQSWGDLSSYNFDLAVINWGDHELGNMEQVTYFEKIPGQKWHIISKFAEKNDVSSYEYIWILDDDCEVNPANIDMLFEFCATRNIDMAQPALTPDSFKTHPSTAYIPGASYHVTDTVEIMCPIFSRRAWPECSAHFGKMPVGVGYGLEGYWRNVLGSASGVTKFGGMVAVIDEYPVRHGRPVTGANNYAVLGLDPDKDGWYFHNMGCTWSFVTIEIVGNPR